MDDIIASFFNDYLLKHIVIICIMFAGVVAAMAIDLVMGIRKAKERGEARNSTGLKKTAAKAQKYLSPMLCLVVVDLMACILIPIPIFTMLWGAYCVFCEFVSVREKSWEKEEILKAQKTMTVIIENKEDIAKLAANIMFKEKEVTDGEV